MCKRPITLLVFALLMTATRAQAGLLTLNTRDLFGVPGERVGWSYSLYNDSDFDLYVLRVSADGTLFGTGGVSAIGSFRDDIAYTTNNDGIIVPSWQTATGTFPTGGLASFAINGNAPAGSSSSGKIFLDYELYDSDLEYQGEGKLTAQYNSQDALASVTVTADVPVPATFALLCIGLGVVGYARLCMAKCDAKGLPGRTAGAV